MAARVAQLERQMGAHDLNRFTPQVVAAFLR